jgi:hypothetical protein
MVLVLTNCTILILKLVKGCHIGYFSCTLKLHRFRPLIYVWVLVAIQMGLGRAHALMWHVECLLVTCEAGLTGAGQDKTGLLHTIDWRELFVRWPKHVKIDEYLQTF